MEAVAEEVDVESIDLTSWEHSNDRPSSNRASGVRALSGRRGILNRIGLRNSINFNLYFGMSCPQFLFCLDSQPHLTR
ncbi:TLC domain-containing protein [Colletotrichum lupini]|uniref:TLC domain-containing protein n=1 Tax=Colletotrichum lupini TaxID=145971 RepID=A0A9Q8WDZ4_9PEZI|nr:TLC domain-containing protein [Colletotrichum lupini]UQC79237.1 TLC domain-containing protein [Colletotrichum lupini]